MISSEQTVNLFRFDLDQWKEHLLLDSQNHGETLKCNAVACNADPQISKTFCRFFRSLRWQPCSNIEGSSRSLRRMDESNFRFVV